MFEGLFTALSTHVGTEGMQGVARREMLVKIKATERVLLLCRGSSQVQMGGTQDHRWVLEAIMYHMAGVARESGDLDDEGMRDYRKQAEINVDNFSFISPIDLNYEFTTEYTERLLQRQ